MAKRIPEFSVKADCIAAIGADEAAYLWSHASHGDADKMRQNREAYEKTHPGVNVVSLMDVNADYDTDIAFIFYVADCFSPPLYLVFGSSFQDAYDTFITEFEHLIKISDEDMKDYTEDSLTINDNGTAVDAEAVQYIAVKRLIVSDASKASRD